MKVDAAMTRDVRLVRPDQTIREAAQLMAEIDAGAIPVTDNDRLVGMITDRDIAVRAVAQGKPPEAMIRDVMSPGILYCFDDQELDEVATNMGKNQVRRLPVIDHDKRLVGILSLGDLASKEDAGAVGRAVSQVSQQGGKHSQTARESA
jgi:CBS domain-containing protein